MSSYRSGQSGNAFMMVFIGIVLFGALAFTFVRSGRQGINNVSTKEATIAASQVLSYAQALEKGISALRIKRISESDLDFIGAGAAYDNPACVIDKCEIFNPAGGKQIWAAPPEKSNDGSPWAITGSIRVAGIAQDANDVASVDLVMFLPNVDVTVCRQLNTRLGVDNPGENPPAIGSSVNFSSKFTGTFTNGGSLTGPELDGKSAACYQDGVTYHFYQVLLAR